MQHCTHKGCGKECPGELSKIFDLVKPFKGHPTNEITLRPLRQVFHEGLKSWSCCQTVNKPVLDFDEFMKIPGCETGLHSNDVPQVEAPKVPSSSGNLKLEETHDGKEVYSVGGAAKLTPPKTDIAIAAPVAPAATVVEEEEDLEKPVEVGTVCRHTGCKATFVSDEESRLGEGPGTKCTYHPLSPYFREGSKGYLCCKRRVLEFDEFLKIEGCKTGRHLFVPKASGLPVAEEFTECRVDHYQTQSTIQVSVFAKKADQEKSIVQFEESKVTLDILLPGPKRFKRTLDLFGPIDPSESSFNFFGTKVELTLKKLDGRSWTILEKTDQNLGNIALTFGVSGRTGTIGAKEIAV